MNANRLGLIIGNEALERLSRMKIIIFGLGGVGSWCAEALVRSGIGAITLVDADSVDVSNINRQVEALPATVGRQKPLALRERLLEINPDCAVTPLCRLFSAETAAGFALEQYDCVIDAIDSLEHKLCLIETCVRKGVTMYSSMGMAMKMDPTRIRTGSVWETKGCPLARLVRQGLRKRGLDEKATDGKLTAVWSDERQAVKATSDIVTSNITTSDVITLDNVTSDVGFRRKTIGSCVTVTAAAGMALASLVLRGAWLKNS
jgi:tRNA A37 threonylcarbamoyladenosine dehydratase